MGNPPAKPENNAGRGWGALGEGNSSDMRAAELGAWREPTWGWHRAPSSSPCLRQAPNPAVPKETTKTWFFPLLPCLLPGFPLGKFEFLTAVGVPLFGPGGWQVELVGRRMRVLALV